MVKPGCPHGKGIIPVESACMFQVRCGLRVAKGAITRRSWLAAIPSALSGGSASGKTTRYPDIAQPPMAGSERLNRCCMKQICSVCGLQGCRSGLFWAVRRQGLPVFSRQHGLIPSSIRCRWMHFLCDCPYSRPANQAASWEVPSGCAGASFKSWKFP